MLSLDVREEKDKIQIYNCGILIIEENNYNDIILTIKEALTIIKNDMYQRKVLKGILRLAEDMKRMVA